MGIEIKMFDKKTHIHSLAVNPKNKTVYRCTHPECNYFARADFIVGNKILCSKCFDETIATKEQLIRDKVKSPTCLKCSKSKKGKALSDLSSILENVFESTDATNSLLDKEMIK